MIWLQDDEAQGAASASGDACLPGVIELEGGVGRVDGAAHWDWGTNVTVSTRDNEPSVYYMLSSMMRGDTRIPIVFEVRATMGLKRRRGTQAGIGSLLKPESLAVLIEGGDRL